MEDNNRKTEKVVVKKKKLLGLDAKFEIGRTVLAITISLAIVLAIVALVSTEPLNAIKSLLLGPFTSMKRFANVIELMIPLTFTGLAVTIVLKTERFNLAAEGGFYMGAIIAAWVGIFSPFPPLVTILIIFILTIIAGAIIGYIPTFINKKFHANELVTSLMLNYVVALLVQYILNHKLRDTSKSMVQSLPIKKEFALPVFISGTRIHIGIFIMIALVIVSWLIIYKTKWGYALRATGSNEKFAKYSGIKVAKVVVLGQIIGIAIAAFGGGIEMLGMHGSFKYLETPGYGFDGVLISILARGNPALVPLAAFFLAFVRVGAEILNRTSDIPAEIVSVVQATIILLIAAKAFLAKYKHKMIVKETGVMDQVKEVTE